jgi:hypothetical protein
MVAQKPSPQIAREIRARAQMADYRFRIHAHPAVGTYVEVTHREDAARTHMVTPQGCSCGDFVNRGFEGGFRCKHQIMTDLWLSNGVDPDPQPEPDPASAFAETADEQRARVEADRDALWGPADVARVETW